MAEVVILELVHRAVLAAVLLHKQIPQLTQAVRVHPIRAIKVVADYMFPVITKPQAAAAVLAQ